MKITLSVCVLVVTKLLVPHCTMQYAEYQQLSCMRTNLLNSLEVNGILHVIGILHTYGAHKRQSRLMKHADETVILRSIRTPSQKTRTKGVATRHVRGMRTRLLIHRGWGHGLPNGRRALHTPTPRHVMTHSALLSRNRVHGHSPFALHRLCHST